MKIQINSNEKITENELRYIFHNLKNLEDEYKKSWEYKNKTKYSKKWQHEMSGCGSLGQVVGRKIIVTASNDTLYFKFKD